MQVLFGNASVYDGEGEALRPGCDVLVEKGEIREVSDRPIASSSAAVLDLRGRTLMPGLIDCHVHAAATMLDLGANARVPHTLQAYRDRKSTRLNSSH